MSCIGTAFSNTLLSDGWKEMYNGREDEEEDLSNNETRRRLSFLSVTHTAGWPEFKSDIRISNSHLGLLCFHISAHLVINFHLQMSGTDMYKQRCD